MNSQYIHFHRSLLQGLQKIAHSAIDTSDQQTASEDDLELLQNLDYLAECDPFTDTFFSTGQQALCRIVAAYPHLAPHIPRDLFWLFGGDCLHYMPDEEIEIYQQLDERRFEAEHNNIDFDYEKERARILGLH